MFKILLISAFFSLAPAVFATAMGDLAASMSAGQWKVLQTQGGYGTSFLETYGCHVGSHSILQYGNKGQWDHNTQQFFFLGSPHGNPNKFIIYSAATNTWREGPLPSSCFNSGHVCGGCNVHSYHLSAIDTAGGRFFFGTSAGASNIYVYRISSNSWSHYESGQGRYDGMSYFPDMKALIYNNEGPLYKLPDGSGSWTQIGTYAQGNTNNICLYSPRHHAVFFGGGNGSNDLYKLDASGNVTTCAGAPHDLSACHTFITHEPVTGNFLTLTPQNQFYEYDVAADTWQSLTPPAPVVAGNANCGQGLVAAPVSTYGVVMFLTYSPPYVLLYKHKDSPSAAGRSRPSAEGALRLSAMPNPFSQYTRIRVEGCPAGARLQVFNLKGEMAADLSGTVRNGSVEWRGTGAAPGVYLVRLTAGGKTVSKRILLAR